MKPEDSVVEGASPQGVDARDLAIETRGLGRDFERKPAVDGLDLRIARGEVYGFLGPNGAGKTTTIRMLNGLLRPTRGEIRIEGRSFQDAAREIRSRTGLVPDTPPLYEFLTGDQYIGFVASLYGVDADQRDADAERWLRFFELEDRADDLCKNYSHGMRKKLHIAAVLCTRPAVLFLDEPTTGLDPRSARRLKDLVLELRSGGTTVFLSTHILDTAEELCDRIGILAGGRLRGEGTMAELRSRRDDASLEEIFLELTEAAEAETEAGAGSAGPGSAGAGNDGADYGAGAR